MFAFLDTKKQMRNTLCDIVWKKSRTLILRTYKELDEQNIQYLEQTNEQVRRYTKQIPAVCEDY